MPGAWTLFLEVDPNPNTEVSVNSVYKDVSRSREVYCVKYSFQEEEEPAQVTGWDAESGKPCPAYACTIEESGDGMALLIYGGTGGIRMKKLEDESDWDVNSSTQRGESHLVYPEDSFIVYKDQL